MELFNKKSIFFKLEKIGISDVVRSKCVTIEIKENNINAQKICIDFLLIELMYFILFIFQRLDFHLYYQTFLGKFI